MSSSIKSSEILELRLRWCEKSLREIKEKIQHGGSGPQMVNDIHTICDNYWRGKIQPDKGKPIRLSFKERLPMKS